ncbi:MAG: hypothetical protein IPK59_17040 [Rhodospirillaceae bacterium]|nr:hypothetical protein [Rhodospirillaceae bacterium]
MQTLLIHNDSAGAGHLTAAELTEALCHGGLDIRHCAPDDPRLDALLAQPSEMVVLAGGDGTIARILAKMPFQQRKVAIVPLGTANNIAQSLGILDAANPGAGNEIVSAWRHADSQAFDIGRVTGPWGETRFAEAVGIGPLARVILQFKTQDVAPADSIRLGRAAFHHALTHAEPLRSNIRLDGHPLNGHPQGGDLLLMEAMNIRHAGSRLCLAPDADIADGLFDVVTIAVDQRQAMLDWVANGTDQDKPPLTITRARSVEIDWLGDPLRIDDHAPKITVMVGPVSIAFVAAQLDILVPSRRDRSGHEQPATEALAS